MSLCSVAWVDCAIAIRKPFDRVGPAAESAAGHENERGLVAVDALELIGAPLDGALRIAILHGFGEGIDHDVLGIGEGGAVVRWTRIALVAAVVDQIEIRRKFWIGGEDL